MYAQVPPKPLRGRLGRTLVAVLCITPDEFVEVQEAFGTRTQILGTNYYVTAISGSHEYDVVVSDAVDRTNLPASRAVDRFVEQFYPAFFLLVGTAGGVRGVERVELGDVVIADYLEYAEFRKVLPGRSFRRAIPYDQPSPDLRQDFVKAVERPPCAWVHRIQRPRPNPGIAQDSSWSSRIFKALSKTLREGEESRAGDTPKAFQANVLSSEKIWGDPTNTNQKEMLKEFDKVAALEMEGYGVASAILGSRRWIDYNPRYLVIRGISDFVNATGNDRTRRQWTQYAAAAAAAFALCLAGDIVKVSRHEIGFTATDP